MKTTAVVLAMLTGILVCVAGYGLNRVREQSIRDEEKLNTARALVARWADRLDRDTAPTGVYNRWPQETLPERDPWGQPVRVSYSQGGIAENVEVRSVGPDGIDHTADDVIAVRVSANLKGIGTGIVQGSEQVAANSAKGAVKGLLVGVKESIRPEK